MHIEINNIKKYVDMFVLKGCTWSVPVLKENPLKNYSPFIETNRAYFTLELPKFNTKTCAKHLNPIGLQLFPVHF